MKIGIAFGLGVFASVVPSLAHAQDEVLRGETVMDRPRPDYDPVGVHLGGFTLYPGVTVQESYDSNIYATPSNAVDDWITSVRPRVDLKSNWDEDSLNFHGGANIVRYANHDTENYEDYDFGADGKLVILHDARMLGNAGYNLEHLPRSSPNSISNQRELTQFSDTSAGLSGEKEFNWLSLKLDWNFDRYVFSDAQSNSGALIAWGRQNFNENRVTLHTGYEFVPGRQVYLLGAYDRRSYDNDSDMSGFNRNSDGYTVGAGLKYDLTGILFADVFAGYREQDYRDSRLGSLLGPTGGAKLTWNVTRLTTITGSITRDVDETIFSNSAGYFATREDLKIDHELLRNLLINLTGGHEEDAFQGTERDDNVFNAGLGAQYLLSRMFQLKGGYTFQTRSSNQPGNSFDDHVVYLGLTTRL